MSGSGTLGWARHLWAVLRGQEMASSLMLLSFRSLSSGLLKDSEPGFTTAFWSLRRTATWKGGGLEVLPGGDRDAALA